MMLYLALWTAFGFYLLGGFGIAMQMEGDASDSAKALVAATWPLLLAGLVVLMAGLLVLANALDFLERAVKA